MQLPLNLSWPMAQTRWASILSPVIDWVNQQKNATPSTTTTTIKSPTQTVLTSGTNLTYTPPTNCAWIRVRMVGGGGGGGAAGTGPTLGTGGGTTTFGPLTANGGAAGAVSGGQQSTKLGGSVSVTTTAGMTVLAAIQGSCGESFCGSPTWASMEYFAGGVGGCSPFGGAGGSGTGGSGNPSGDAQPNSGSGGGGAGCGGNNGYYAGGGGAAGGYIEAIFTTLESSYTYSIGAGGATGSGVFNGGAGGSGVIIIEEYYSAVTSTGPQTTSVPSFNCKSRSSNYSATYGDWVLCSGASFTVTLPTAAGFTGQQIVIQHNGTSLTQIYTLNTTNSQTIGGIAGGSYALYTNSETLTLISDGANWQILQHKTRTGRVAFTATLQGFGTITTQTFFWERDGSDILVNGHWIPGTPTAVAALIFLPGGMPVDTTKVIGGQNDALGVCQRTNNSNSNFPSTSFGPWAVTFEAPDSTTAVLLSLISGNGNTYGGTTGSQMCNAGDHMSVSFRVPIQGWQP